jgi:hypothetical protein
MEEVGIFYGQLVCLRPFCIFYGHLVYFVVIWYIILRFGILYHEKSGSPVVVFRQTSLRRGLAGRT